MTDGEEEAPGAGGKLVALRLPGWPFDPPATRGNGDPHGAMDRWTAHRGVRISKWDDAELDRVLAPLV